MHVSLSELEATLGKAASGLGLPLGLGQDAGRAARWLAGSGADPVPAVVEALDAIDRGRSGTFDADQAAHGTFAPELASECLSSLRAGPSACDLLLSAARSEVTLEAVDSPAVILMLACMASRDMAGALRLTWHATEDTPIEAVCAGGQLRAEPDEARALSSPGPATVTIRVIDGRPPKNDATPGNVSREGVSVGEATWRRLSAYADRCLVEATESSRLTGAGAGIVDTD